MTTEPEPESADSPDVGLPEIQSESSQFYLHVARRALADLQALDPDAVRLGGLTFGSKPPVWEMPSDHFRHAVVCTVFSAAAVEHALVALALMRRYLSYGVMRAKVEELWPKGWLSAKKLLELAATFSKIDAGLLERIRALMKRRDQIVHSQAEGSIDPVEGLPGQEQRRVDLPKITTQVIADAPGDVALAEEAVAAIRAAWGERGWSPFGY
ncbi:MAG TPA: hypothetical protein VFX78_03635 [Candidatus Eisenbacteria bacterium]|jgi:hypothetical protein|nr:hypothetical protein [Candidatus Eisenbacteria bacterium]